MSVCLNFGKSGWGGGHKKLREGFPVTLIIGESCEFYEMGGLLHTSAVYLLEGGARNNFTRNPNSISKVVVDRGCYLWNEKCATNKKCILKEALYSFKVLQSNLKA